MGHAGEEDWVFDAEVCCQIRAEGMGCHCDGVFRVHNLLKPVVARKNAGSRILLKWSRSGVDVGNPSSDVAEACLPPGHRIWQMEQ